MVTAEPCLQCSAALRSLCASRLSPRKLPQKSKNLSEYPAPMQAKQRVHRKRHSSCRGSDRYKKYFRDDKSKMRFPPRPRTQSKEKFLPLFSSAFLPIVPWLSFNG